MKTYDQSRDDDCIVSVAIGNRKTLTPMIARQIIVLMLTMKERAVRDIKIRNIVAGM